MKNLSAINENLDLINKQYLDDNLPTSLAELSSDSTHRVVTDSEKNTWNNKIDKPIFTTSLPATLVNNTIYQLGELTANISFALPNGVIGNKCQVQFTEGGTVYNVTLNGSNFTSFSLSPVNGRYYELTFEYNEAIEKWIPSVFSAEV